MMELNGTRFKVTLFNWHAHTSQDGIQQSSFKYLEDSVQLRRAYGEAQAPHNNSDLVIIAGDLNNQSISSLGNLQGISQKYDHIFANSGANLYSNTSHMEADRKNLITSSGDHTAVGALIDY